MSLASRLDARANELMPQAPRVMPPEPPRPLAASLAARLSARADQIAPIAPPEPPHYFSVADERRELAATHKMISALPKSR